MRMFTRSMMTAALALVASPVLALAASNAVSVESALQLDKTVTVNGKTTHELSTPKTVVPGNHLLFVYNYHNTGKEPATNFALVNPVSGAVALETAAGDNFDVSVDGGKTWGSLSSLTVATPGASPRAAQPADVTHVRWVIPVIAPGATGTLSYHAVVR